VLQIFQPNCKKKTIIPSNVHHLLFSGGHFNPAVSFAVALARKMSFLQMTLYWFAQIAGAIVGALFLRVNFFLINFLTSFAPFLDRNPTP
jgi:hypothetical protein